jgi:hypothetical protein
MKAPSVKRVRCGVAKEPKRGSLSILQPLVGLLAGAVNEQLPCSELTGFRA